MRKAKRWKPFKRFPLLLTLPVTGLKPGVNESLDLFLLQNLPSKIFHSYLSATSGSTFAALRAGNQQAAKATNSSSAAITMKVHGSVPRT